MSLIYIGQYSSEDNSLLYERTRGRAYNSLDNSCLYWLLISIRRSYETERMLRDFQGGSTFFYLIHGARRYRSNMIRRERVIKKLVSKYIRVFNILRSRGENPIFLLGE